MPLLQLRDACLAFGHIPLLEDVNLVIEEKERVCLVGRNGTGKSSLLNVLNGQQPLDSGTLEVGAGTIDRQTGSGGAGCGHGHAL